MRDVDGMKWGSADSANYPRLVRDRIPEIIEAMGNVAVWHQLDDDDRFASALLAEIVRTSQRFADTESLETLSDLLEAIDAWLGVKGLTMEEASYAREEKRKRCGAFDRRLFLERVAPGADVARRPLCQQREC